MLSKGKWGLAVFFFSQSGTSGHQPFRPWAALAGPCHSWCPLRPRRPPTSGAQSGLSAGRSAPRGGALKMRPPRRRSSRVRPSLQSARPTQCPRRRSPSGSGRARERQMHSLGGRYELHRAEAPRPSLRQGKSVCPRGPRQRPLAPRSPGLWAAPSRDRQGAGEPTGTLDNGARAGRLAWGRAPGAGVASLAACPRSAPRGAGPPVSQLAGPS